MRVDRYYVKPDVAELKHDFWLHDERLINQWNRVLRLGAGSEVVLFDGLESERLYKIVELNEREAHLELVTEYNRKLPSREVYLLFALLKKDKNDWVLQKCTELGVSHFVPLLAERSEKTGFDVERAEKIVIEAAEQCGRSDIPAVREPVLVATALEELQETVQLLVCEQSAAPAATPAPDKPVGVLIGPEGGWSDAEKALFTDSGLGHIVLHDFTLRAETACVSAATSLLSPSA